ncbi:MAG: Clp protease N-terminal domain-containing protein [Lachnospiraceae bacterium]|jgi:ATP-dependent Clp protease ATP-binding subunit ClpB
MNIQKFTQKSVEAINNCSAIATENGNQQVEQVHLLDALLRVDDSLIVKLLEKMNIDAAQFTADTERQISNLVKVQGQNMQQTVSQGLNKCLIEAETEAKKMGDDYVSVEHIFLSMLKNADRTTKPCLMSTTLRETRS